jgi:hypothetical protein
MRQKSRSRRRRFRLSERTIALSVLGSVLALMVAPHWDQTRLLTGVLTSDPTAVAGFVAAACLVFAAVRGVRLEAAPATAVHRVHAPLGERINAAALKRPTPVRPRARRRLKVEPTYSEEGMAAPVDPGADLTDEQRDAMIAELNATIDERRHRCASPRRPRQPKATEPPLDEPIDDLWRGWVWRAWRWFA